MGLKGNQDTVHKELDFFARQAHLVRAPADHAKPHAAVLAVDDESPIFQFQFFRPIEFKLGLPRI